MALPNSCLYFNLAHLYRTLERAATAEFALTGVAPTQAFMLLTIGEKPSGECTAKLLAETINLDPSTVTRLLAELERRTLIRKVKEGRFVILSLTPRGRALLPELRDAWKRLIRSYTEELGAKYCSELLQSMGSKTRKA